MSAFAGLTTGRRSLPYKQKIKIKESITRLMTKNKKICREGMSENILEGSKPSGLVDGRRKQSGLIKQKSQLKTWNNGINSMET